MIEFQSTRPVWGATHWTVGAHAYGEFQSTRPVWGATVQSGDIHHARWFQSTRPVWGATSARYPLCPRCGVSIHAPHAGRDMAGYTEINTDYSFNPRAPCGARRSVRGCGCRLRCFNPRAPCGARHSRDVSSPRRRGFQSTRPMRGATENIGAQVGGTGFNPRAPCGARPSMPASINEMLTVSIHAPRVGRDIRIRRCLH